ncbi:hypothetical protein BH23ACT9_BH23ACT9_13320 [soil metagenome]
MDDREAGQPSLELPDGYVPRQRLSASVAGQATVVVEAGGGFGKTTLVAAVLGGFPGTAVYVDLAPGDGSGEIVVLRLARALEHSGLTDLGAALRGGGDPSDALDALAEARLARNDRLLLAVDDAHHATGHAVEALVRLARTATGRDPVLVAARRLPPDATLLSRDALVLDEAALAFTVAETVAFVGGDEVTGHQLHERTNGWPAGLVLSHGRPGWPATADRLDAWLGDAVDGFSPPVRTVAVQTAYLEGVDDDVVTVLAEALDVDDVTLDDLRRTGLPFQRRPSGLALLDPVAEALRRRAPLDPDAARAVANHHAERGAPLVGARLLMRAGRPDDAASVVARMSLGTAAATDTAELRTLVDRLPAAVRRRHPRAVLHLARSLEYRFDPARPVLLDELRQVIGDGPTSPLAREVLAEVARDAARLLDFADAVALADAVLAAADPSEDAARARCLDALAWVAALADGDYDTAGRLAEQAIAAAARTGVTSWVAEATMTLAIQVHIYAGALDTAERVLGDALALLPPRSAGSAVARTFLADVLIDVGRPEDAAFAAEQAYAVGRAIGNAQAAGYAAWSAATAAAALGDTVATVDALTRAEQHRGEWFRGPNGATFLARAAGMLERLGESALSDDYLARARRRRDEAPWDVVMAEAAVAIRRGDPAARRLLSDAEALDGWTALDRLRLDTLRAAESVRRGADDAGQRCVTLFDTAAALGVPALPLTTEPDLGATLIEVAIRCGSTSARVAARALPITIQVMGGFAVTRAGRPVEVPPGHAVSLLQLAAVRSPLRVDDAASALLPDVAVSRAQTLLHEALMSLVEVGGFVQLNGGWIGLGEGVRVDAREIAEATLAARRLRSSDPRRAAEAARRVVERYGGEFLPGVDARWADVARSRLRRDALWAHDVLGRLSAEIGDIDGAIAVVERAVEIDGADPERRALLADLYLAQGRGRDAGEILARAAGHPGVGSASIPDPLGSDAGSGAGTLLTVLGGFTVVEDGIEVAIPGGNPLHLVALLTCSHGAVPVARVIDVLWPGVDERTGRGRLREVLRRLRRRSPLVVRTPDGGLALAAHVRTDLAAFEEDAALAEAGGPDAVAAARRAMSRYRGPLMPSGPELVAVNRRRALAAERADRLGRLLEDDQRRRADIAEGLGVR